jgi:hypothetical protein
MVIHDHHFGNFRDERLLKISIRHLLKRVSNLESEVKKRKNYDSPEEIYKMTFVN